MIGGGGSLRAGSVGLVGGGGLATCRSKPSTASPPSSFGIKLARPCRPRAAGSGTGNRSGLGAEGVGGHLEELVVIHNEEGGEALDPKALADRIFGNDHLLQGAKWIILPVECEP